MNNMDTEEPLSSPQPASPAPVPGKKNVSSKTEVDGATKGGVIAAKRVVAKREEPVAAEEKVAAAKAEVAAAKAEVAAAKAEVAAAEEKVAAAKAEVAAAKTKEAKISAESTLSNANRSLNLAFDNYENATKAHRVAIDGLSIAQQDIQTHQAQLKRPATFETGSHDGSRKTKRHKQAPNDLSEPNVSCCKLGYDFFRENNLVDYAQAAERCLDQKETIEIIQRIERLSQTEHDEYSAFFCCLFASSGTGKTQLAATASIMQSGARYFLMSGGEPAAQQRFYRPHILVSKFVKAEVDKFVVYCPNAREGASSISAFINEIEKEGADYECGLVDILAKILIPSNGSHGIVSLRKAWKDLEQKPLVFLDEFPSSKSPSFSTAIVLRDFLRALGIYPILMSTHTGAQNAVSIGTSSRGAESTKWAHVFVRLPPYARHDKEAIRYSRSTERPLVTLYAKQNNDKSLAVVIDCIKEKLQSSKVQAWTGDPVFQFCQLLRSKGIDKDGSKMWHNIVGCHFGHFKPPSSNQLGEISLPRTMATRWRNEVGLATPSDEPLLFLALTSWRSSHLNKEEKILFPIVNNEGEAVPPRQVFDLSPDKFRQCINTTNPEASKLEGDHLEALALASITLASLEIVDDLGPGVDLPRFLSSVLHFVSSGSISCQAILKVAKQIAEILSPISFTKGMKIPPCGSADSHFPRGFGEITWGELCRPPDKNRRDGFVRYLDKTILHIECKNIQNGISTDTMKEVISRCERPTDPCQVFLLFASSLNVLFHLINSWKEFSEKLELDRFAFLHLKENEKPQWLTVSKGKCVLCPNVLSPERREFLFVIFETGAIKV